MSKQRGWLARLQTASRIRWELDSAGRCPRRQSDASGGLSHTGKAALEKRKREPQPGGSHGPGLWKEQQSSTATQI